MALAMRERVVEPLGWKRWPLEGSLEKGGLVQAFPIWEFLYTAIVAFLLYSLQLRCCRAPSPWFFLQWLRLLRVRAAVASHAQCACTGRGICSTYSQFSQLTKPRLQSR